MTIQEKARFIILGIKKAKSTLSNEDKEEIIKELDEIDDIFEGILESAKK